MAFNLPLPNTTWNFFIFIFLPEQKDIWPRQAHFELSERNFKMQQSFWKKLTSMNPPGNLFHNKNFTTHCADFLVKRVVSECAGKWREAWGFVLASVPLSAQGRCCRKPVHEVGLGTPASAAPGLCATPTVAPFCGDPHYWALARAVFFPRSPKDRCRRAWSCTP